MTVDELDENFSRVFSETVSGVGKLFSDEILSIGQSLKNAKK